MNLNTIFTKDLVTVRLKGGSKQEIIEQLLDILMTTGKISDRGEVLKCILERESKMSTGIEEGIAIPHGKSDSVKEMVACAGLVREGTDFQALDGKPSRLFILTLSPASQSGPHIRFLSYISNILQDRKLLDRIFHAGTDQELLDLLNG